MPSSTRKARLSEQGYGNIMLLTIPSIMAVVAEGTANFVIWLKPWSLRCDVRSYSSYESQSDSAICSVANLLPNWFVAVIVLAVALGVAVWAYSTRDYWYREVTDGVVVGFDWYSSSAMYTSGYQEYRICIRGKTRSGDTRSYWHPVSPKTYFEYHKGDRVTFKS